MVMKSAKKQGVQKRKAVSRKGIREATLKSVAKFLIPITPTQIRRHKVGISNARKKRKAGKGLQK